MKKKQFNAIELFEKFGFKILRPLRYKNPIIIFDFNFIHHHLLITIINKNLSIID